MATSSGIKIHTAVGTFLPFDFIKVPTMANTTARANAVRLNGLLTWVIMFQGVAGSASSSRLVITLSLGK